VSDDEKRRYNTGIVTRSLTPSSVSLWTDGSVKAAVGGWGARLLTGVAADGSHAEAEATASGSAGRDACSYTHAILNGLDLAIHNLHRLDGGLNIFTARC
jgi:hypothetical protein